jgi:hypothetical protein
LRSDRAIERPRLSEAVLYRATEIATEMATEMATEIATEICLRPTARWVFATRLYNTRCRLGKTQPPARSRL